jgi:Dodecin
VLVHDDDLMPSHPRALEWTLDAAARVAPFALGAAGVVLKRDAGYWQSQHVGIRARRIRRDMRVDIVKGCYFCTPRSGSQNSVCWTWTARMTSPSPQNWPEVWRIRATATLRNVRSAWIKEQEVQVEGDRITAYKVIMKITFVLE